MESGIYKYYQEHVFKIRGVAARHNIRKGGREKM